MADYTSEVRINTKLDNSGISRGVAMAGKEIDRLTTNFEKQTDSIKKQTNAIEEMRRKLAAIEVGEKAPASLVAIEGQLRRVTNEIKAQEAEQAKLIAQYEQARVAQQAAVSMGDPAVMARATAEVERLDSELLQSGERLDTLYAKSDALAGKMSEIKLDPASAAEAQTLKDKIELAEGTLERSKAKANELRDSLRDAFAADPKPVEDGVKRIGANAKRSSTNVKNLGKQTKNAGLQAHQAASGFERLAGRITRLVAAAFVFNVIRRAITELRKYMGLLLQSNKEFMASWNAVRVNLLSAFSPIWEAIQPALLSFMNVLAKATQLLASFIAMLFGKTYAQAKSSAKALDDQAKSLDKTGAAAKKATKQLYGFDEINQHIEETAEGAGGASEALDFGAEQDVGWLKDVENFIADLLRRLLPLLDATARFREMLKNVWMSFLNDFLKPVGEWVMGPGLDRLLDILIQFFNKVDWERITASMQNFFKALAGFTIEVFKGLLDFMEYVLLPLSVWTLSEAFPRFVDGLTRLMKEINWTRIREGLIGVYDAIVPFAIGIGEGLLWFYEEVLVPFGLWLGQKLIPALLGAIAAVIKGLDADVSILGNAFVFLWERALRPLLGFVGDVIIAFLEWIGNNGQMVADILLGLAIAFIAIKAAIAISDMVKSLATAFKGLGTSLSTMGGPILVALGGLVGMLASIRDYEPGVTLALSIISGALVAFGIALTVGMGPVGWVVGIIAGLITAITTFAAAMSEDVVPAVERFNETVSDSTKKALNPIIDLADEASEKITGLFLTGKPVVEEDTAEIAGYFKDMADTAVSELERMKRSAIDNLASIFGTEAENYEKSLTDTNRFYDDKIYEVNRYNKELEDGMKEAALQFGYESTEYAAATAAFEENGTVRIDKINEINAARDIELGKLKTNASEELGVYIQNREDMATHYEEKVTKVETAQQQINDTLKTKLKEGETLTEEDYATLMAMQGTFLNSTIEGLAANKEEALSIQQTRASEAENIRIHETAAILEQAAKERDESIAIAEDKYNKVLEQANKLKEDGTEAQKLMADEMIAQAERDRDESIVAAKGKYDGILTEASTGIDNIDEVINTKTGKIQSKWDQFWSDLFDSAKSFWNSIPDWLRQILSGVLPGGSGIASLFSGSAASATPSVSSFGGVTPMTASYGSLDLSTGIETAASSPAMASAFSSPIVSPQLMSGLAARGARQGASTLSDSSIATLLNGIGEQIATVMSSAQADTPGDGEKRGDVYLDSRKVGEIIYDGLASISAGRGTPFARA